MNSIFRQAEPHTHVGKKRHEVIMASGIARGRIRVTQDGGHTRANRLTETYTLGVLL